MIKTCPHCNQVFDCKSEDILNCDCMKINLSKEAQIAIGKIYTECLCLNCLRKFNHDPEKELITAQQRKKI